MRLRPLACSMLGVALFSGCSSSSPNASSSTGTGSGGSGTTPPTQTIQQILQSGQASGALPTLDTGTTVAGTDSDNNGVRDDIDKFIANLPDTATQKKALTQVAASLQSSMLVDATNATAVAAVSAKLNNAAACTFQVYTGGSTAQNRAFTMEEISVNTMPRIKAYQAYNNARNFTTVVLPTGTVCQ